MSYKFIVGKTDYATDAEAAAGAKTVSISIISIVLMSNGFTEI